MEYEQVIRQRDHHLALDRHGFVEEYAREFPVTESQVRKLMLDAANHADIEVVTEEPAHVVAHSDAWQLTGVGWNEDAAIGDLVHRQLWVAHPPDDKDPIDAEVSVETLDERREEVMDWFGEYEPPAWETQVLEQGDGEYTEEFTLTHLTGPMGSIPQVWEGWTADGESVYIKYRGGSLRIIVDGQLAYREQVERWPGVTTLSTPDLLGDHWPHWATYVYPLDDVDDAPYAEEGETS